MRKGALWNLRLPVFVVRFWVRKQMITSTNAHCRQDVPSVGCSKLVYFQRFSAVSFNPTVVCCLLQRRIHQNLKPRVKSLEYKTYSVYCQLKWEAIAYFSVLGKTDMFSILQTLLVQLSRLLDE